MKAEAQAANTKAVAPAILQEMTEAIVQAVHPRRIVLFGSQARRGSGAHSDVDFLVVEDPPLRGSDRFEEMIALKRVLAPFRVPKDVLVYDSEEVERWRHAKNHVIAHALREGRVLYERP